MGSYQVLLLLGLSEPGSNANKDLFENYLYSIGPCVRKKIWISNKNLKKQHNANMNIQWTWFSNLSE